jgi:addiction module RelE/StbE family toxin
LRTSPHSLKMTKTIQAPRVEFSVFFNKQLTAAPREIRVAFLETLQLYRDDPDHPSLRNHALKDKYAGFRSVDVTGDWRALYRRERERIIFVELGTHDQLYGENS